MSRTSSVLFCIALLLTGNIRAQSLMHGFGTTLSILTGKIQTSYSTSSYALSQTTLTYFPRFNFVENGNSSISIGAPVGIGLGIASNTFGNDAGIAFAYDLPVVFDYNMGFKSTMENENNFGGYVGLGFGYYKVNISKSQYSDYNGASYGPIIRGGVRIGSSNESWQGHGFTVGIYYKKGLEKDKLTTIGFNVLIDL